MSRLISRLKSSNLLDKTEATYAVTRNDIRDNPEIISLMRENLNSKDDDLLEITIMRIGLRAADLISLDKIITLSQTSTSALVISACVLAMSSIAEAFPEARDRVRARLVTMKDKVAEDELANIIQKELVKLGAH